MILVSEQLHNGVWYRTWKDYKDKHYYFFLNGTQWVRLETEVL